MPVNHQFTSSEWVQSGSIAKFKSGIDVTGSVNAKLIGDGSALTGITTTGIQLFIGSESLATPPTYGEWITGSGGNHTITLSVSASGATFNHFTFLRQDLSDAALWEEASDYSGTQKGLVNQNSLTDTLGTGIYRYLLLAMSTASKQTLVTGTTVIINPDEL
tara:strand:+ start:1136 stop:1621 length:486 start_codon:yes stop_codon:yes gene_type:complete